MKVYLLVILALFMLGSNSSFAVTVTCYSVAVPNEPGCYVYLSLGEIQNGSNGTISETDAWSTCRTLNDDWHINPKTSNPSTPNFWWVMEGASCFGDVLYVWAAQVHDWDFWPRGYHEIDHDTQDEGWAGAG